MIGFGTYMNQIQTVASLLSTITRDLSIIIYRKRIHHALANVLSLKQSVSYTLASTAR